MVNKETVTKCIREMANKPSWNETQARKTALKHFPDATAGLLRQLVIGARELYLDRAGLK